MNTQIQPQERVARVSVAIMCHPSRLVAAEQLRESMRDMGARIIVDPEPTAAPNAVRCAAEAWAAADPGATHHLVVQDDVVVCRGFRSRLNEALRALPESALSLFSGWSSGPGTAARIAALSGRRLFRLNAYFVPAQAVLLPAALARGAAEFLRRSMDRGQLGDSILLREYLRREGQELFVTMPTLVQHDMNGATSLLGNSLRKGLRRSVCFADDVSSPMPDGFAKDLEPDNLPYVSPEHLDAVVDTERQVDTWKSVPVTKWMGQQGLDVSLVHDTLGTTLSGSLHPWLRANVRDGRIAQLWMAAFCLGWSIPKLEPELLREGALGRAALRTLAPGALRRVLPDAALDRLAECCQKLVLDGVLHGWQARSSARGELRP